MGIALPCAIPNSGFASETGLYKAFSGIRAGTDKGIKFAILKNCSHLIMDMDEERKLCLRYRRIPIPRKILHKGGNVRYYLYRTFPRRVLRQQNVAARFRPAKLRGIPFAGRNPSVPSNVFLLISPVRDYCDKGAFFGAQYNPFSLRKIIGSTPVA